MLKELKRNEFKKVAKLFTGDKVNLEPEGVVWGYNPGWIYVDNRNEPNSAMIWVKGMKGFYFAGDANNKDFNKQLIIFFDNIILPRAKSMNYKWIELSGMSDEWDTTLAKCFCSRKGYAVSKQFVYKHKNLQQFKVSNYQLKSGYRVKVIDKELLNSDISNFKHLESKILNWWNSFEDFLKHGVGYSVMHENKVISTCIASFKKKDHLESDIHTLEEYRKQGFATIAVSLYLEYCRDNCLEPYWDCMETNYGSRALATKLGYEKQFEYTLFEFLV